MPSSASCPTSTTRLSRREAERPETLANRCAELRRGSGRLPLCHVPVPGTRRRPRRSGHELRLLCLAELWNLPDLFREFRELRGIPHGPAFPRDSGPNRTQRLTGSHRTHELAAVDRILAACPGRASFSSGIPGKAMPRSGPKPSAGIPTKPLRSTCATSRSTAPGPRYSRRDRPGSRTGSRPTRPLMRKRGLLPPAGHEDVDAWHTGITIAPDVAIGRTGSGSMPATETNDMASVDGHPTVAILCLGFLLMIGFWRVVEGFGYDLPKGYLYATIGFPVLIKATSSAAARAISRTPGGTGGRAPPPGSSTSSAGAAERGRGRRERPGHPPRGFVRRLCARGDRHDPRRSDARRASGRHDHATPYGDPVDRPRQDAGGRPPRPPEARHGHLAGPHPHCLFDLPARYPGRLATLGGAALRAHRRLSRGGGGATSPPSRSPNSSRRNCGRSFARPGGPPERTRKADAGLSWRAGGVHGSHARVALVRRGARWHKRGAGHPPPKRPATFEPARSSPERAFCCPDMTNPPGGPGGLDVSIGRGGS